MARPLPEKQLVKMDLSVETLDGTKTLGKQVGYNKYRTIEDNNEIVMLVEELKEEGDALLLLDDNGEEYPVIKIVENLFHTSHKPYGYVLDANGKPEFLDNGVKLKGESSSVEEPKEPSTTETPVEPETPATPAEPETPTTPETPVEPETPATPGE